MKGTVERRFLAWMSVLVIAFATFTPAMARDATPGAAEGIVACEATAPNGSSPPRREPDPGYHGVDSIWTSLSLDGVTVLTPQYVQDGEIHSKTVWWRASAGALTIEGERLDAAGAQLRTDLDRQPDSPEVDEWFYVVDIIFPSEGCWRVTARVGDHELAFVMELVIIDLQPS